jgi:hypothetical protein
MTAPLLPKKLNWQNDETLCTASHVRTNPFELELPPGAMVGAIEGPTVTTEVDVLVDVGRVASGMLVVELVEVGVEDVVEVGLVIAES